MAVWVRGFAAPLSADQREIVTGKRRWSLTGTAAFRLIAALLLAAVVMQAIVLLIVLSSGPWDDAYMFVRYANNFVQHGTIAWNPDGAPTYGLTSLLFLAVVVPLRMVLGFNPYAVATSASLACSIGFIVLLTVLVHRHVGASQFERRVALLIVYLAFAISAVPLAIHSIDGMDTTFAMTHLTAYILVAKWHERLPRLATTACVGVLGGLAFSVRPDLLLYALLVPASLLIVGPDRRARLAAVGILGITGAAAAVHVVLAAVYFGSPLPLPFYAKALSQYGEFFHERFAGFSARMLQEYIGSYWFLMCIGLSAIVPSRRLGRLRTSGVNLGLAVATVVFIAYYATSVLQIMGMFERFYYPTLPAIAFLAAVGAARLARPAKELLQRFRMKRRIMALTFYFALVQAIVWVIASLSPGGFRDFSSALSEERLSDLNTPCQYAAFFSRYWYGLDRFSALPDNLVIATTEVGIPGVLNPGKRIVDIAGLNDTRFALTGFSTQSLLREDHPDLIYMPHPGYHDLIAQIRDDAQFQNDYEFFTSDELGGARMEVAIWRGSQYYSSMREIIREGRPAGAAVAGEPHQ